MEFLLEWHFVFFEYHIAYNHVTNPSIYEYPGYERRKKEKESRPLLIKSIDIDMNDNNIQYSNYSALSGYETDNKVT